MTQIRQFYYSRILPAAVSYMKNSFIASAFVFWFVYAWQSLSSILKFCFLHGKQAHSRALNFDCD